MATRRARIKAVASLPVRRKNNDAKPNAIPKSKSEPEQKTEDSIEGSPKHDHHAIVPAACPDYGKVPVLRPNRSKVDFESGESSSQASRIETNSPNLIEPVVERLVQPDAAKLLENSAPSTPALVQHVGSSHGADSETTQSESILKKILSQTASSPNFSRHVITQKGESTEREEGQLVDGIVRLPAGRSRAVELLKSEIISESAEVLFDPIVPLPSPGKLRHKLRPVPRLATPRRNSVQGSASESEDEHKRALQSTGVGAGGGGGPGASRVRHDSQSSLSTHQSQPAVLRDSVRNRNDSVCSVVSHAATALPSSPVKDKHLLTRSRRNEMSRVNALRRKLRVRGDPVKRDQLTMYDLIFYNPTTNPIVETQEEKKGSNEMSKVEAKTGGEESEGESEAAVEEASAEDAAPAPQIKLGPDGQIIIDEKSLVIKQTESRGRLSASVVQESEWCRGGAGPGGRYSRAPRTKQWADAETVKFYRALAAVGTDFSLMLPLFPDRCRRDLKTKFKKEERLNGAQVDKALTAQVDFELESLVEQFATERRDAAERARRAQHDARQIERAEKERIKRAREQGVPVGRAARATVEIIPTKRMSSEVVTAEDIITYNSLESARSRNRRLDAPLPGVTRRVAVPTLPPPKSAPKPAGPSRSGPAVKLASATHSYDLPAHVNPMSVAKDVAAGSLVCLTIPDPHDPSKKVLQTYVSDGCGNMTPISLPPAMLGSVMDYMNRSHVSPQHESAGSPAAASSEAAASAGPTSSASAEHAGSAEPLPVEPALRLQPVPHPSPLARVRHNSYTITNL